jgi:hypothetical protein
MWKYRAGWNAGFAVAGFVAGIGLMLALGFAKDPNESEKEILPKNTFSDLRITVMPLKQKDINAAMTIYKGDTPIIIIYRNDSNEVDRFGIANGRHGILALGGLAKSGISKFGVYGNEVHGGRRTPVLTMVASDKPGVWYKVRYAPTFIPVYDGGKLTRYRTVGELYTDLDFDGQFDAKEIWNDKSVIVSESILIKGEWRELGRMDSNGRFSKRAGAYDPNDLSAFTEDVDGGNKTYFDFVPGKGWRQRSQTEVRS